MKTTKINKRPANVLIVTVIILLLLAQCVLLVTVRQQNSSIGSRLSTYTAQRPIGPSETGLIADAATKRLYLPGLDLYVPMSLDAMDLTYRVTDASGGDTLDIAFMSKLNAYYASEDIPAGCLDLVRVEIGASQSQPAQGETVKPVFKLADGRAVHTYVGGRESGCRTELPVTPQQIENVVKRLQSY